MGDKSAFVAIMDRVKLMNITGKALSGEWGNEDTTGEGTCVLRTANFTNEGVFNYDEVVTRKIPSKKGLENKYLRRGDIVIEKSGGSDKWPVGRVIYFNEEENKYLFNNFTGLLRVQDRKKWNPKYVFYSLYFNYLVGGTRQYENKTTGLHNLKTDLYVENFKVKSISKAEQDDIVTKIDKIRHIIDAKNKQILMFDELIKARFVEMFGGNDKKVAISSLCDVLGGYSFKSEDISSKGFIKILQIGNVYLDDVNWETTNYLPKEFDNMYSRFLLNEGDIVIALTRPIIQSLGNVKACIVKASDTPCLLNQRVGRIVSKKNVDVNLKFIYGCLMTDDFTRYVESCCIGCSQPNISTKDIENYMIPDASYEKQMDFVRLKEQVDKSKFEIQKSLEKTQQLYDSLMQKYFG